MFNKARALEEKPLVTSIVIEAKKYPNVTALMLTVPLSIYAC